MARGQPHGHGLAAERDLHAVGGDDVALGRHGLVAVREPRDVVPVGAAHDDARAVAGLQHLRPADMVGVRVRNEHVLDVLRIEAELLHPATTSSSEL